MTFEVNSSSCEHDVAFISGQSISSCVQCTSILLPNPSLFTNEALYVVEEMEISYR